MSIENATAMLQLVWQTLCSPLDYIPGGYILLAILLGSIGIFVWGWLERGRYEQGRSRRRYHAAQILR